MYKKLLYSVIIFTFFCGTLSASTPLIIATQDGRLYHLNERQLLEYQRLLRKGNNEQILKKFFTGVRQTALEQLPEVEKERILTAQKRWNGYPQSARVLHVVRELKDERYPLLLDAFEQWAAEQTIEALNAIDPNEQIPNPNDQGFFPLFTAAFNGNTALVKTLLDFGAAIDQVRKNSGASSLLIAASRGHSATVEVLIKAGANVNQPQKEGATPLYIACQNGHVATAQLLIAAGANVNLPMNDGPTPLYIACQNGHTATAQLLIAAGANVNLPMNDGATSLFIACQNGHTATAQLLITAGANVDLPMNNGATPLHVACEKDHPATAQLLIMAGANVNLPMDDGTTPLYIACQEGHTATAQLLITASAKLNQVSKYDASPLVAAIHFQKAAVAELLMKAHADFDIVAHNNNVPLKALDLALQQEHQPLVPLLKTAYENKMKKDAINPHLLYSNDHTCPICWGPFSTAPIVLHSPLKANKSDVTDEKHLCCSECIQELINRNRDGLLLCPQCQTTLPKESLQKQIDWFKELKPELAMRQELMTCLTQ